MPIWSKNATKYQIEMWYQYYTVFEIKSQCVL